MILLDQDFGALLDLGQDGVDVAGKFGFGNAERPHTHDHSGYSPSSVLPSLPQLTSA